MSFPCFLLFSYWHRISNWTPHFLFHAHSLFVSNHCWFFSCSNKQGCLIRIGKVFEFAFSFCSSCHALFFQFVVCNLDARSSLFLAFGFYGGGWTYFKEIFFSFVLWTRRCFALLPCNDGPVTLRWWAVCPLRSFRSLFQQLRNNVTTHREPKSQIKTRHCATKVRKLVSMLIASAVVGVDRVVQRCVGWGCVRWSQNWLLRQSQNCRACKRLSPRKFQSEAHSVLLFVVATASANANTPK